MHVPEFDHLKLEEVAPGAYKISALQSIEMLKQRPAYQQVTDLLEKWSDDGYLRPEAIRREMQSLLYKSLNQGSVFEGDDDGNMYGLKYHQDDPGHRIEVYVDGHFKFNIKITALIKFHNWISDQPQPSINQTYWGALGNPRDNTFHPSYDLYERKLIKNRYYLKMAIRLLKKLAKRHSIPNLGNAFIKNICMSYMDHIDYENDIHSVLCQILCLLNDSCKSREISNYWHSQENLMSSYTKHQMDAMAFNFSKVFKMWNEAGPQELKGLFREFFFI